MTTRNVFYNGIIKRFVFPNLSVTLNHIVRMALLRPAVRVPLIGCSCYSRVFLILQNRVT